jgi:hypothetical protein
MEPDWGWAIQQKADNYPNMEFKFWNNTILSEMAHVLKDIFLAKMQESEDQELGWSNKQKPSAAEKVSTKERKDFQYNHIDAIKRRRDYEATGSKLTGDYLFKWNCI